MHSGKNNLPKLDESESDNKMYDIGSEFKFFRLDRGYIPQYLADRLQIKKQRLDMDNIQAPHEHNKDGYEIPYTHVNLSKK